MAKGVRMDSCRKKNYGDEIFYIDQIRREDRGKLICRYCSAKVVYVSSYSRKAYQEIVPEHLRLGPNENHDKNCPNTVVGAVKQVVADSRALEDNHPIFEEQGDETFVFRMNLLKEAQETINRISKIDEVNNNTAKWFIGNKYIKSGQQIESYFRSAVGVARIRSLIEENAEIEQFKNTVKIKYQDNLILWNDFYYDSSRYHVLVNKLKKKEISYPIALKVTVENIRETSEMARDYLWSIQCSKEQREEKKNILTSIRIKAISPPILRRNEGYRQRENQDFSLSRTQVTLIPHLQISTSDIVEDFVRQRSYIVVGDVWLKKKNHNGKMFYNINIAIHNKAQFRVELG